MKYFLILLMVTICSCAKPSKWYCDRVDENYKFCQKNLLAVVSVDCYELLYGLPYCQEVEGRKYE